MAPQTTEQTGQAQIAAAFARASAAGSAAFMPYFTLGYPDRETSLDVIEAIAPHSDLLELGVPFSDPLADGPTIQHSTQVALENGTTVSGCLDDAARTARRAASPPPACLMGYYNPILAYGLERFVLDARGGRRAGLASSLICRPRKRPNWRRPPLMPAWPTSIFWPRPVTRPASACCRAGAGLHLSGQRHRCHRRAAAASAADLPDFVDRVRTATDVPLAIGFGISTPEQAATVGRLADGVIVGSALVSAVDAAEEKPAAAAEFARAMHDALKS